MSIVEKMARARRELTGFQWKRVPEDLRQFYYAEERRVIAATGLTETQLEGLANGTMVVRPAHKAPIGDGDWFWRDMDPDDCGDSIHEALRHVPDFVVCLIGASYSAGSFFAARVPTLSDDDDTEELIAETEQECIRLVAERRAMLAAKEG